MKIKLPAWLLFILLLLFVTAVSAQLPRNTLSLIEKHLMSEFKHDGPGGVVLVAKGGKPVFHRAYGMADVELGVRMRTDNMFGIGSITKQFTAVAILKLVEEGKLSLDDDVRKFVPDLHTGGYRITTEQILTHTSGLPNFVDHDDFEALSKQQHSVAELLALTKDLPLHFEPGSGYRYSDTGYIALGAVIEKISGISYAEFVESKMFRPLGMTNSFYGDNQRILKRRAKGYSKKDGRGINAPFIDGSVPHAAGALISTAEDLLKWDNALRDGTFIGKELLQRAWTETVLPDGRQTGHGFGWSVCPFEGRPTIEQGGWINGFTSRSIRFPDVDLNVIVLVNNDDNNPDGSYIARRVARIIFTGSPDFKTHTISSEQRARLAGVYQTGSGGRLMIIDKDGAIHARWDKGREERLAALSPTELTYADSDGSFIFRFGIKENAPAARVEGSLGCSQSFSAVRTDQP